MPVNGTGAAGWRASLVRPGRFAPGGARKHLAGELTAAGHRCSPQTTWRLLHQEGF
jgi:hypothetical protein